MCVKFTASDAYMRDFHLFIPQDCTASNSLKENNIAFEEIEKIMKADLTPSAKLNMKKIIKKVKEKVKRENNRPEQD